ncbi:MAG: hypothetical protein QXU06_06065 [Candidatus Bathyarchaeia archaeon]
MGKVIHLDRVREFARSTPIFRARDIGLIVKDGGYSGLILHKLARRGEVNRVVKGWYSIHDDPIVSVFCFRPAYIGMQEALSLRGIWEQETNVVILTTRRVRVGVRDILGSNVVLHRLDKKYFFGFELLRYDRFFIPVSDLEKTLIDLVYFNEVPGRDVLREIEKGLDRRRLGEYLARYPTRFGERVRRAIS